MVFDDFFDWMESDAGEMAWRAIDEIQIALEGAEVDALERKIIWADGDKLGIDQSAEKIKQTSEIDIEILKKHIVLWLEMDFTPKDLNQKEMKIFEEQIFQWIKGHPSFVGHRSGDHKEFGSSHKRE